MKKSERGELAFINGYTPRLSDLYKDKNKFYKPESLFSERNSTDDLVEKLMQYEVISFDIFDTLILRPFANPLDVFLLLASSYKESNFYDIRILSDREARIDKYSKCHTFEVDIFEIYIKMSEYLNIDSNIGAKKEMELEMDICFANPYMKRIYDILSENNKKIIAISDMYFPKKWILNLLHKCGYTSFVDVFVSCDYGVDKRSSELFKIAEKKWFQNTKFIHIGDSNQADVVGAKKAGWDSFHYPSVNFYGGMHRARIIGSRKQGLSPLIGSACNGVINAHLHNGLTNENDYYEYGYKCGGPFAVGFATWIHDVCKIKNIDKILFTSRDCYTIKLIYERLFGDIPCEYALWSRAVAGRTCIKSIPYYFKKIFLYEMRAIDVDYTVIEHMKYLKIDHLLPLLQQYGLAPETLIGKRYAKQCERYIRFVLENIREVEEVLKDEENAAKEYYQKLLKESKNAVIIDIGWSGSNINILKNMVENEWNIDCSITGLLAVMHPYCVNSNSVQLLTKQQQVYMFSAELNAFEMNYINEGAFHLPFFYEILSGAPHSSLYRIEHNERGDIQFVFDIPEIENFWIYDEIRRGMLDFCDDYRKKFKKYDFMLRIPGSDSAMIIKKELMNMDYMKEIFGNFSYNKARLIPSFKENVTQFIEFIM